MNILISTIMRNASNSIDRYFDQINRALDMMPEHNWFISIYENDSTDNTVEKLRTVNLDRFVGSNVMFEKLNTTMYPSIKNEDRVNNLATARNKSIFAKDFINQIDYVLMVEPDVSYDPSHAVNLVNFKQYNLIDVDVFSGISVISNSGQVYDTWATRRNSEEQEGSRFDNWQIEPVKEFWSTFNCVVLYNAEPFKNGIKFSGFNRRLNTYDCDTVVICEEFRENGYNKIYAHQGLECYHN